MEPYHIVIDNNFWDLNFQTIVSLIILLASLYISYRGNQTAQENVEKTIKANRDDIIKDKIINLKIRNVDDLISVKNQVLQYIYDLGTINQENYVQYTTNISITSLVFNEIVFRLKINIDEYKPIDECIKNIKTAINNLFTQISTVEEFQAILTSNTSNFLTLITALIDKEIEKLQN